MKFNTKDMIERSIKRSIPGIAGFISGKDSNFDSISLSSSLMQICKLCSDLLRHIEKGSFIFINDTDIREIKIASEDSIDLIKELKDDFCVTVSVDGYLLRKSTEMDFKEKLFVEYLIPSLTIYYENRPIGNIKSVQEYGKRHRWEKNAKKLRDFDELIEWFEEKKVLHGTALDHLWKNKANLMIVEEPEKKIQSTLNEFFFDYILEPILVLREVKYPSGICDFRLDDQNGYVILVEVKIVGKMPSYTYKSNKVAKGVIQLEIYCSEEKEGNIGRLLVFDGEKPRESNGKEYNCPSCLEIRFVYMVKDVASHSS